MIRQLWGLATSWPYTMITVPLAVALVGLLVGEWKRDHQTYRRREW